MAHADATFYRETYKGRACDDDSILNRWLSRASDDIDAACGEALTLADLDTAAQAHVKRATCAQAETYIANGDGLDDDFESASIGSFSVSKKTVRPGDGFLSARAQRFLDLAGLTFAGVGIP